MKTNQQKMLKFKLPTDTNIFKADVIQTTGNQSYQKYEFYRLTQI